MADNVTVTPGTGALIACDEVTDPILGTVKMQVIKIADGTNGGTNKALVNSDGSIPAGGVEFIGAVPTAFAGRNAGVAASALPAAATSGRIVEQLVDLQGRPVVRRIIAAERNQSVITIGQAAGETTLLAGVASVFHDLLSQVMAESNGLQTQVEIRAATGGAVRMLINIPAFTTVQVRFEPDFPNLNNTAAANWTAKVLTVGTSVLFYSQWLIR